MKLIEQCWRELRRTESWRPAIAMSVVATVAGCAGQLDDGAGDPGTAGDPGVAAVHEQLQIAAQTLAVPPPTEAQLREAREVLRREADRKRAAELSNAQLSYRAATPNYAAYRGAGSRGNNELWTTAGRAATPYGGATDKLVADRHVGPGNNPCKVCDVAVFSGAYVLAYIELQQSDYIAGVTVLPGFDVLLDPTSVGQNLVGNPGINAWLSNQVDPSDGQWIWLGAGANGVPSTALSQFQLSTVSQVVTSDPFIMGVSNF